jgi:hypothetical protein
VLVVTSRDFFQLSSRVQTDTAEPRHLIGLIRWCRLTFRLTEEAEKGFALPFHVGHGLEDLVGLFPEGLTDGGLELILERLEMKGRIVRFADSLNVRKVLGLPTIPRVLDPTRPPFPYRRARIWSRALRRLGPASKQPISGGAKARWGDPPVGGQHRPISILERLV